MKTFLLNHLSFTKKLSYSYLVESCKSDFDTAYNKRSDIHKIDARNEKSALRKLYHQEMGYSDDGMLILVKEKNSQEIKAYTVFHSYGKMKIKLYEQTEFAPLEKEKTALKAKIAAL